MLKYQNKELFVDLPDENVHIKYVSDGSFEDTYIFLDNMPADVTRVVAHAYNSCLIDDRILHCRSALRGKVLKKFRATVTCFTPAQAEDTSTSAQATDPASAILLVIGYQPWPREEKNEIH